MEKKYLELAENLYNDYSAQKYNDILRGLNTEEVTHFLNAFRIAAENHLKKVREKIAESEERTRKAIERREKIAEAEEKAQKAMENNNKVSNTNGNNIIIGMFPIGEA